MQLTGSRALVTGATGGIGLSIARALDDRGCRLRLTGRDSDTLRGRADEFRHAQVLAADLSSADEVAAVAEWAGDVDIVVHAAAVPASGLAHEFTSEELDAALRVNLHAPLAITAALTPGMLARGRGQHVFVSSISGRLATPRMSVYSATKFGLRGFAQGLRQDLAGTGVGVSTVLPGPIADAGMWVAAGVQPPSKPRPRQAADVAEAVVTAIVGNKAEVYVSRPSVRAAVSLADVAPDLVARVLASQGADELGERFAAGSAARSNASPSR